MTGGVEHQQVLDGYAGLDVNECDRREDGSLLLAPDTWIAAIRRRTGTRPMTTEQLEQHWPRRSHVRLPPSALVVGLALLTVAAGVLLSTVL